MGIMMFKYFNRLTALILIIVICVECTPNIVKQSA